MKTVWGIVALTLMAVSAYAASSIVQIDGGSRFSPIADVTVTGTATLISAANPARVALNCTNTSGSVNVRWAGSTVTATLGQRLPFGTSIEIRNIGAVYMISEGANVTVSCTEELQ